MSVRRGVGLRLFGPFQLVSALDRSIVTLKNKRARGLLAYLAMQPGCVAGREILSNLLWPECPDANARHSLRQCLSSLRKELDEVAPALLRVEQDVVSLDQSLFEADARELLLLDPNAERAQLNAVLKSFSAEFLAGFRINEEFFTWTSELRRKLAHKAEEILTRIDRDPDAADDLTLSGVAAARLLAQSDPFSDDYRRLLISLTAQAYGPGRALAEYRSFVEFLRNEQEGGPDERTLELVREIETRQPRMLAPQLGEPAKARNGAASKPAIPAADPVAREVHAGPSDSDAVETNPGDRQADDAASAAVVHRIGRQPMRWLRAARDVASGAVMLLLLAMLGWTSFGLLETDKAEATALAGLMAEAGNDSILRSIPVVVRPFEDRLSGVFPAEQIRDAISGYVGKIPVVDLRPDMMGDVGRGAYRLDGRLKEEYGQPVLAVQLTRPDGTHVWSEKFGLGEGTSITSDIGKRIGRELDGVLVRAEAQAAVARKDVGVGALLMAVRAIQLRGHTGYADPHASKLLQQALKADDDSPLALASLAGQIITSQSHAFRLDRKLETQAEGYLRKAIGSEPNLPLAHFYMGLLHKSRGDAQLAIGSFNRTLELNPSFAPAYANLGHALMLLGRTDDALRNVNYAIRISPNDSFAAIWYVFAGEIEFERGNIAEAIDFFRSAVTRAPHLARAYAWIAGAYQASGDHAAAASSIRQFRAMLNVQPAELMQRLKTAPEGGLQRSRPKMHQALQLAVRQYL